jgi:hypothetical protein
MFESDLGLHYDCRRVSGERVILISTIAHVSRHDRSSRLLRGGGWLSRPAGDHRSHDVGCSCQSDLHSLYKRFHHRTYSSELSISSPRIPNRLNSVLIHHSYIRIVHTAFLYPHHSSSFLQHRLYSIPHGMYSGPGVRAKAWCHLKHAEASASVAPFLRSQGGLSPCTGAPFSIYRGAFLHLQGPLSPFTGPPFSIYRAPFLYLQGPLSPL